MTKHPNPRTGRRGSRACTALLTLLACSTAAQAGITIRGTRVVFAGPDNEVTVQLDNDGQRPELVQVWLDSGHAAQASNGDNAFFMLAPALFRVEPGKGQMVRILRSRQPLPTDRESLFWLNVREVPHKARASDAASGALRFVFSTRIKLMYRPPGLPGSAQQAPAQLQWALATGQDGKPALQATNPTAYVVNLGGVDLQAGGATFEAGSGHVGPGETATFPVRGFQGRPPAGGRVVFNSLNDAGAAMTHEADISP